MAATPKQIATVQKVLYEPRRLRTLSEHLSSINMLMNLDPRTPLQPGDQRVQAGAGPTWLYPSTGAVSWPVLEASRRCDRVAQLLLRVRSDLADVDFDRTDKRHLSAALAEQAAAWKARGAAWRAPGKPDVEASVAVITAHQRASILEFQRVKKYLKNVKLGSP